MGQEREETRLFWPWCFLLPLKFLLLVLFFLLPVIFVLNERLEVEAGHHVSDDIGESIVHVFVCER
jgi:hypothetical protein